MLWILRPYWWAKTRSPCRSVPIIIPLHQTRPSQAREHAGDTHNSLNVQVKSPGGPAGLPYGQASPGGLCDTGNTAVNGVSVATGADWTPPSPFDAARSLATGESGRSVGYSTNGVGWYRKTFKVDTNGLASPHWEIRFDGVYMNAVRL